MVGQTPIISFMQWAKLKRYYLRLSAVVIVLQFVVFKWLYPYPNFLPDSFSYLETAMEKRSINIWPIGYSWFLELFGLISRSHWWLVSSQYVLLEAAILYLVFSTGYLLQTSGWLFGGMLLTGIASPLVLHISNFVSSDALFAALSLVWFTQLLWILCKPKMVVLVLHAFILLIVFTVRYNAMYYPFVSITVILFTGMRTLWKWGSIALVLFSLGAFIGYTQVQYYKETGSVRFSPFSGWQLASNALYAYAYVPAAARSKERFTYIDLQRLADRHMDSLQRTTSTPALSQGIYYLWNSQSPLQRFPTIWWGSDSTMTGFKRWTFAGSIYREYASYLVRTYPTTFLRHYVWPNLVNYYVPPPEFLGSYNMGKDTVDPVAVQWFRLQTKRVYTNTANPAIDINAYYPLWLALLNLFFVLAFTGFVLAGGFANSTSEIKKISGCLMLVWICNIVFSVIASPVVLRYHVFSMLVMQTVLFWLGANVIRLFVKMPKPASVESVKSKSVLI